MLRMVERLRTTAVTTPRSSPEISVTSAASMATSVPVPIAMPTSAWGERRGVVDPVFQANLMARLSASERANAPRDPCLT
jgi:hypothetical protein